MKFLVFLALAVACVMAQQQPLEEQPRDKRDILTPVIPSVYPTLYRGLYPTTYASHYPYTYQQVYPYSSYYPTYHSLPYVYYK